MAFGPYTQPVKPAEWVDPLDLNMYAKGMAYKQDLAEKNLQSLTNAYSSAFGVPAYGVDARRLSELEQGFRDKISSLNLSNLSDMGTVSQLKGLVNQYTSPNTQEGRDLLSISKRGTFYKDELQRKKEADEKGLPYYGRALKNLENYYSQNDFYTDPKDVSLNSGFIGVNLSKERAEVLKNVPKEKYLKNGYYYERYNPDALKQALTGLYSDTRIQRQLTEDLENKWDGKDWETDGINEISEYKKAAQNQYNEAIKANRADIAGDALKDIQMYDQILQDPKGYAEQLKRTVYNQELENRINTDIEQSNFNSVEKASEYGLKAQELAKQKELELYKTQLDLFPYLSAEDQTKVSTGRDLGTVNWNTASQKFAEQKKKDTLESKLDDWQAKQNYQAEYKNWEDNSKALDTYYNSRLSGEPKETTASYQTELQKGESLVKQNLPEIVNYLKNKYPTYKDFLEGKTVNDIVWQDGDVYLDVSGSARDQDVRPEHIKEAIESIKAKSKPTFKGQETSQTSTSTFDKSKLDTKTLKALEDNIKANPGVSEEEVAKAMGLM